MGILKTDRREDQRVDPGDDRRTFPRPPLWLNLLILGLALAGVAFARYHRHRVESDFSEVINEEMRTPEDLSKIKNELAKMNLTRRALAKELDARLKFAESLKSNDFYLAVDTQEKKLRFYYGDTVLREGDLVVGEGRTLTAPGGKSWTFVPLKGAFPVEKKSVGMTWEPSEWAFAMNNEPMPAGVAPVKNGLGKFVIFLGNGYLIHSPPAESSPLKGAKPGSFMATEADLEAIWARIRKGTPVYVF